MDQQEEVRELMRILEEMSAEEAAAWIARIRAAEGLSGSCESRSRVPQRVATG